MTPTKSRRAFRAGASMLVAAVVGTAVRAEAQSARPGAKSLHQVTVGASCSAGARAALDSGTTLLHHMTYPRAREAFLRAASRDPRCAMAHWGIAMTLFQPLWPTRPGPADLRRGWEAVRTARSLEPSSERERLFIAAAAAFFEPDSADYWRRIVRWEAAMAQAYAAFPDDAETAAFYALAHLAAAPTDTLPQPRAERAATLLLAVLERRPGHPGAQHYLIHANDAAGRERNSPDVVRRYAAGAPRNPHALHMPTHIQTRLGEWDAVIEGNRRAAAAALENPAGDRGEFVWDEYPHAVEYLVYAMLQQGDDEAAGEAVERLHRMPRLQPTFKTAFHLASTRARHVLERRAWREATKLPVRTPASLDWDRFTWPEAVTWFARGLGAAHERSLKDTRSAERRLLALESAADRAGEPVFASNIRILRLELAAWLAHAEGDTATSRSLMREAAELEVATPKHAVTPGPTLPAHELLGDLLSEQARPAEALSAYRRSLELYPRRFNSLLGAARAAGAAGDTAAARAHYRELLEIAAAGARRRGIDEARAFVSKGGTR